MGIRPRKARSQYMRTHGVGIAPYDALVSINVPHEKAHAAVQVLETEVFDRLATKQDLIALESRLTLALTVRVGAMLAASIGLVLAAIKAFH